MWSQQRCQHGTLGNSLGLCSAVPVLLGLGSYLQHHVEAPCRAGSCTARPCRAIVAGPGQAAVGHLWLAAMGPSGQKLAAGGPRCCQSWLAAAACEAGWCGPGSHVALQCQGVVPGYRQAAAAALGPVGCQHVPLIPGAPTGS